MKKLVLKNKEFIILLLLFISVIAHLSYGTENAYAHSPHDVIDSLALSPSYDQDKTLFIIIGDKLLKSINGGFSWRRSVNGLDNKHLLKSIAVSPSFDIDETLFVSSDGDGIYRSRDGGGSWVKVNNGLDELQIDSLSIFYSYNKKIVFAAGNEEGLYKTKDEGSTWYRVMENVRVSAIAFSPSPQKDHAIAGDQAGNLYLSTNNGETWEKRFQILNSGAVTSIAISPNFSSDSTFFVGTENKGLFKTVDGGASFLSVTKGLTEELNIRSIALSPDYKTDTTIFVSTWHEGVFASKDDGNTWKKHNKGITWDRQANTERYRSPSYRDLKISKGLKKNGTIFLGGFDGLFKSENGGKRWIQMETRPLRSIRGLAVSAEDGDETTIAITTYGGGAYTTNDQGVTWFVKNNGLKTTRLSDIVFSPNHHFDKEIFSASMGSLLKSTKKDNRWNKIWLRQRSWRTRLCNILHRLKLSKPGPCGFLKMVEKGLPWPTALALSPNFGSDSIIYFGTRRHGIFKSTEGGLNPSIVWEGLGRVVTTLVISPDFSRDGTLFAGLREKGVYKTVDGGDTWRPINNGLGFVNIWEKTSTIHQLHEKDIKLVISPSYNTDKTLFAGSSAGLFRTTDGGDTWQQVESEAFSKDSYITALGISPSYQKDQTLIVSIRGRGLFKSDNGGATFSEIAPDLINNNHAIILLGFSVSYEKDSTIYAASNEELFQSTDGGNTWRTIKRPVRYENHRDVIHYEGDWKVKWGDEFSASRISHSNTVQNRAVFSFMGTGVSWIGTASKDQGIAKLNIDGNFVADIDQFNEIRKVMKLYSVTDLTYGPHTLEIEVSNEKNPKSTNYRIEIDAFDVIP